MANCSLGIVFWLLSVGKILPIQTPLERPLTASEAAKQAAKQRKDEHQA
jgi:hypothetical protein